MLFIMGKSKQDTKNRKKSKGDMVKVSKRLKANINLYKGQSYCHLTDIVKDKSISMSLDSIKSLCKAIPKIVKTMQKIETEVPSSSSSSESESE